MLLQGYDNRFRLFEDWAALPKSGYPAFINLWRLYCMIYYARLLRAAGLDSTETESRIEFLKQRLRGEYFDEHAGLFISGKESDGLIPTVPSLHEQILAILIEFCPEHHSTRLNLRCGNSLTPLSEGRYKNRRHF